MTWVTVSGPHDVAGKVLVSRQPELLTFSLKALNPFARREARDDASELQSFTENTRIFYDRAALGRSFITPVRYKVLELPRRWLALGFDGSAMLIAWRGMETDAAIVEQAFSIGETCLELLGEQLGPSQRHDRGSRANAR
jgi:hypothetical protein